MKRLELAQRRLEEATEEYRYVLAQLCHYRNKAHDLQKEERQLAKRCNVLEHQLESLKVTA